MKIQTKTPAVDKSKADTEALVREGRATPGQLADNAGINNDHMIPIVPRRIPAPSERVEAGRYNTWIVLGRDRPSTRASGFGGTGDTHAASIDICAGMMGSKAGSHSALDGKPIYCDPDMMADAARIYISQKTNIDANFKLAKGRVGTSAAKSGIAMKADAIRIVAREGIKLVTRSDKTNSQGSDIISITGVDIIAGNDDDSLQPMVKGNNLVSALTALQRHVAALNGIVDSMLMNQLDYNSALMNHWHNSPFFAQPTAPSQICISDGTNCVINALTEVKKSLLSNKANLGQWRVTYLKPYGKKYINSRWNNVN